LLNSPPPVRHRRLVLKPRRGFRAGRGLVSPTFCYHVHLHAQPIDWQNPRFVSTGENKKKCPIESSENCLNSAPNPVVGRESHSAAQLSDSRAGYALLPCCWCGEPMRRARSSKALRCTISSSKRKAPHLFLAKVRGIFLTKCPNPFNFCCSLESPN